MEQRPRETFIPLRHEAMDSESSSSQELSTNADAPDRLSRIVAHERWEEDLWLSIYQSAWEESYDAQIIFDQEGTVARANRKARLMLRCGSKGLNGKSVEELIPERFRSAHRVNTAEYLKDPTPRLMSEQRRQSMLTVDGEDIPVEISLSPLDTESGLFINAVIRHKRGVQP